MTNILFHHFGIACRDIDSTSRAYEYLGYKRGDVIYDPIQNINICFLSNDTMPMVELLAPADENSPVVQILEKNGVTPYHTCYEVENLDDSIRDFKRQRYIVVSKPKVACAIDGRRVAFLFNTDMGLIELVEK